MQTINISALDTLFFRGVKPFTMGQETTGSGLFPPSPSVIYGALRTTYFAENQPDFQQFQMIGKDATENLVIKHIAYSVAAGASSIPYFPAPLDLVTFKDKKDNEAELLEYKQYDKGEYSNAKTDFMLCKDGKVEGLTNAFINRKTLEKYLNLSASKFRFKKRTELIQEESKVGVGLSKQSRAAEEGQLYFINMIRPKTEDHHFFNLAVTYSNLALPENGVLRIGGEGKSAIYEKIEPFGNIESVFNGDKFKLYLSTPALFEQGWLPNWIDENTLTGTFPKTNTQVKLMTCAVGKPVSIGGFDVKKQQPKPMLRAVPAGSVYYFEIQNGSIQEIIDALKTSPSISDYRPKEGFGLAFIGKINKP